MLVRREACPRPAVLTCGPITLDPATRTVHRSGRPIELLPKEFALFEVFMRHPDEALSRSTLLEHAWGWAPRSATA